MGLKIRKEDEFNPWPSFVDIFSAVILVLMLFLLVTVVNIGYYAQFKYKVQYTGSITTDKIILHDVAKRIKLEKIDKNKNQDTLQEKSLLAQEKKKEEEKEKEKEKEREFEAATDIESSGEDVADKKKSDQKSDQRALEDDKIFYITYKENEMFVDGDIIERLKNFITVAKEKYPEHRLYISAIDPSNQISISIIKQITLGRILGIKNLLKKWDYNKQSLKMLLREKPTVPEDITIENGVLVIEVNND